MQLQAGERVEIFLKRKLQENKLKRIHLAQKVDLSAHAINQIYNGKRSNTSFKTVLILANYFSCSVDEVLGRNTFIEHENDIYQPVIFEKAIDKIRDFVKIKFIESNENVSKFSKNCGLEEGAIREFIRENRKPPSIFSNNILTIADHFNISLDELIGRSNNKNKTISINEIDITKVVEEPNKPQDISQKVIPPKNS